MLEENTDNLDLSTEDEGIVFSSDLGSDSLTTSVEDPIPPSGSSPETTETNRFGQTFRELNPNSYSSSEDVYNDLIKKYPLEDTQASLGTDYTDDGSADEIFKSAYDDVQKLYSDKYEEESKIDLNPNNINFKDVYTELSDGTFTKRYDDFLVGVDNEERLAQNQSTSSKWINGISKNLVGKVATNVLGGTIGAIVSLPEMISKGSMDALYDNNFNNWLDDLNTVLDNKLPNYYRKDEQDLNFFQKLGTANFYANDLTSGVSFLVGAAVSEGIWAYATGGASLATSYARLSMRMPKYFKKALSVHKGLSRDLLKSTVKNLSNPKALAMSGKVLGKEVISESAKNSAINWAKFGKGLNTARFTYTSSGHESGIEARHYLNQARANYLEEYAMNNNGATPSEEEYAVFMNDATKVANSLFTFNMALVGGSNVMTLGRLFGVMPKVGGKSMTTGVGGFLNKNLFGLGMKGTAKEGFEKIGRSKLQKFALGTYSKLKTPLREGFFEEGLQASGSNAAEKWLESRYSSKAQDKNISVMKSFYEGLSHTYGTKEGWNEIGIGMLIGALGGAVNGEFSSGKEAVKNLDTEIDSRNRVQSTEYALRLFKTRFENTSQLESINQEIQEAETNREVAKQQDATMRMLTTKIDLDYELGDQNNSLDNLEMLMDSMSDQKISEETGIEVEDVAEYKKDLLEQFSSLQKTQIKNREFADAIFGDTIQDKGNDIDTNAVKKALAFTMTMGESSYDTANLMLSEAQALIGDSTLNSVLDTYNYISGLDKDSLKSLNTIKDKLEVVERKLAEVDEQLGIDFAESEVELNKGLAERLNVSKQSGFKNTKKSNREIEKDKKQNDKNKKELDRLNRLTERKIKLEKQKAQLSDDLQDVNIAMNAKNSYSEQMDEGYITLDMLKDMDNNLEKVNRILSKMEKSDPQRASKINKLLKEYGVAKNNLKNYNEITQQIVSGNYNVSTKSMFNRKRLDAQTKSLINKLTNQAVLLSADMARNSSTLLQEEYDDWKESSKLTDVVRDKIVAQKRTGILSKKEREIYREHKDEIDKAYDEEYGDRVIEETNNENEQEVVDKTFLEKTLDRIKKAISYNSSMEYVGIDVENSKRPTKEEIERYQELKKEFRKRGTSHNKVIRKENPEKGIEQEFQKLNTKLANWRMIDSAIDENGTPLVTLLDRAESLQNTIDSEKVVPETKGEDLIKETSSIESDSNNNDKSISQVWDTVVVKFENWEKKKDLVISHLKPETLLQGVPEDANIIFLKKEGNRKAKQVDSLEEADVISVESGGNTYTLRLESKGRIRMSVEDFNSMNLPFKTVKPVGIGGVWGDLYRVLKNGLLSVMPSDFKLGSASPLKIFKFDQDAIMSLKEGDKVSVELDFRTDYNTNNLKQAFIEGKMTVDEVVDNMQIFLKKGKSIVGVLKASEKDNNDNPTHTMIRESFRESIEDFLTDSESMVETKQSEVRIPIEKVFLGRPNFIAKRNEKGEVVYEYKPITKRGAKKIIDYGFVDNNGDLRLKGGTVLKKGSYRDMTVQARKRSSNAGKMIPIVVLKEGNGKQTLVMPVNLTKTKKDFTQQIEDIERSKISREDKLNELINLAVDNGLDANEYLSEEAMDITKLLEDLNSKVFHSSTDSWMEKSHNKFDLIGEIELPLNLDNRLMTLPKFKLDYDSLGDVGSNNSSQYAYDQNVDDNSQNNVDNNDSDSAIKKQSDSDVKKAKIEEDRKDELESILNYTNIEQNRRPNGSMGTQGFTPESMSDLVTFINKTLNLNIPSDLLDPINIEDLINYIKSDNSLVKSFVDYVKSDPAEINILPDGSIAIEDGNHRSNLLNLIGAESIPSLTTEGIQKAEKINAKYDAKLDALESQNNVDNNDSDSAIKKQSDSEVERSRKEELSNADLFHGTATSESVLSGKYDINSAFTTAGQAAGAGLYLTNDKKLGERYSEQALEQRKAKKLEGGKPEVLYFNSKDFNIVKKGRIGEELFNKIKEKYPENTSITADTLATDLFRKLVEIEYGVPFSSSLDTSDMIPVMLELGIDGIEIGSQTVLYNFEKIKSKEINAKYDALESQQTQQDDQFVTEYKRALKEYNDMMDRIDKQIEISRLSENADEANGIGDTRTVHQARVESLEQSRSVITMGLKQRLLGLRAQSPTQIGSDIDNDAKMTEFDIDNTISLIKSFDDINSINDLRDKFRVFVVAGNKVKVTKDGLEKTGLYTELEIDRLLRDKASILKLEDYISRLLSDINEDATLYFDNSFVKYKTGSYNSLGKTVFDGTPEKNKLDFLKEISNMSKSDIKNHINNSRYTNLKNKIKEDPSIIDDLYKESSKYILLKDSTEGASENKPTENLEIKTDNTNLESNVNDLLSIDEEFWLNNEQDATEWLDDIQNLLKEEYNINMPYKLRSLYKEVGLDDIKSMVGSIYNSLSNLPEGLDKLIDDEINKFDYNEGSTVKEVAIKVNEVIAEKLKDKTLVYKVTDKSDYEMFSELGLLYITKNIYQKIDKSQPLKDLYKKLLDKFKSEGKVKTMKELKDYVESKRSLVNDSNGNKGVDVSELDMMVILKEINGYPYIGDPVVLNKVPSGVDLESVDNEYLEDRFVSDLSQTIEEFNEQNEEGSPLKTFFSYLEVDTDSNTIKVIGTVDPNLFRQTLEDVMTSLTELSKGDRNMYIDIKNYLKLTKYEENPMNTDISNEDFSTSQVEDKYNRSYVIENPNSVEESKMNYNLTNVDGTIWVDSNSVSVSDNLFIRFGKDVYEQFITKNNKTYYSKLPKSSSKLARLKHSATKKSSDLKKGDEIRFTASNDGTYVIRLISDSKPYNKSFYVEGVVVTSTNPDSMEGSNYTKYFRNGNTDVKLVAPYTPFPSLSDLITDDSVVVKYSTKEVKKKKGCE